MLTNFPNGATSFGIQLPAGDLPATKGRYIFVDYGVGSDDNDGVSIDSPVKTIAQAYSMATTNKDDVIVLMGSSTHVLTEMLTVAKNRVHFVGMDASGGRRYGQNAKVSLGVTTAATDIATIEVTGVRCTFHNIKFMNSNTVAQGIYCFVDAGEYTVLDSCEIYKSTDLDVTGAAELVANGDSSEYRNCFIGSTANAISGAILRPCVLLTGGIVSGKKARDVSFRNCILARKCGNSGNRFVYGANATDVERILLFEECIFWNGNLAAADPAENIEFGAAQTEGSVLLKNCTAMHAGTIWNTADGVYIDGAAPTNSTSGIAVQTT